MAFERRHQAILALEEEAPHLVMPEGSRKEAACKWKQNAALLVLVVLNHCEASQASQSQEGCRCKAQWTVANLDLVQFLQVKTVKMR